MASGAEMSWLPLLTVIDAPPVPESVSVLVPAMVYLLALSNTMAPVVCAESTVTVRGAWITVPNVATAPAAFGAFEPAQLLPLDQLPSASTAHEALVGPLGVS